MWYCFTHYWGYFFETFLVSRTLARLLRTPAAPLSRTPLPSLLQQMPHEVIYIHNVMPEFTSRAPSVDVCAEQHYLVFEKLVQRGFLAKHQIGILRAVDNSVLIAHTFATANGVVDTLMSPDPEDNYKDLLAAHLQRAFQLIQEEM